MKKDTIQSAQSAFAITFTSANSNEYPVIYAEDQWHTANKNDEICTLYDKTHVGNTTSATGAQFTQREVNETLAKAMKDNQSSVSNINREIESIKTKIDNINTGIVNVYRYKGSVNYVSDLDKLVETSKNGDVYNVRETGMNYAFVGKQTLYLEYRVLSGERLHAYAETCYTGLQTENMHVLNMLCGCNIGVTLGDDGNKKMYAIITSPESHANEYVDLDSYDESLGYYKATSDEPVYYTVTNSNGIWDALGASQGITLWEE